MSTEADQVEWRYTAVCHPTYCTFTFSLMDHWMLNLGALYSYTSSSVGSDVPPVSLLEGPALEVTLMFPLGNPWILYHSSQVDSFVETLIWFPVSCSLLYTFSELSGDNLFPFKYVNVFTVSHFWFILGDGHKIGLVSYSLIPEFLPCYMYYVCMYTYNVIYIWCFTKALSICNIKNVKIYVCVGGAFIYQIYINRTTLCVCVCVYVGPFWYRVYIYI